jgi:amidase
VSARVAASPLVLMSAAELAAAVRSRAVSCLEVMAAHLDQIERLNPAVNAIVSLQDRDALLEQAQLRDRQLARGEYLGCMHGLPHAVKDLTDTRGIRSTRGSPLCDVIPAHDSILVERLRRSGALLIGKTNSAEFGLGSQTYNPLFGTTRNAYRPERTAGGSSGGAAAALALRMLPVADGSDMMGSLRNPAAYNNVYGFRPSLGRVPASAEDPFLDQLACWGAMGRSITDVALLMSVIAGPDSRIPQCLEADPGFFRAPLGRSFTGVRLGWLGDLGGYLPFEPGILELCRTACRDLEHLGCRIEELRLPCPPERLWQAWVTLRHWQLGAELGELYRDPARRARMKPEAQWEVEGSLGLSALDVRHASLERSRWFAAAAALFERCEYLLLPSAQVFPFDAGVHWPRSIGAVAMDTYHRWMEVVVPASLLGCPVLSVPVGFGAGELPMGMQIIGRPRADFEVLQLGFAYEQATRWVERHPPALLS